MASRFPIPDSALVFNPARAKVVVRSAHPLIDILDMKLPHFTPKFFSFRTFLAAGVFSLLSTSCSTWKQVAGRPEAEPVPATPEAPKPLFEWNGEGKQVSHLLVDVDAQRLTVFSGNEELGWATVASGIHKFPTPTGDFKVIEKVKDKKSNLYGKTYNSAGKLVNSDAKMGRDSIPAGGKFTGATMPYYMRLTGDGVGMHAGPIPNPGSRASHGCIRLPRAFAPILFAGTSLGTPVKIVGDGPAYSSYIAKERATASRAYAARAKKKAAAEEKAPATPAPETSAPVAAPAISSFGAPPAVSSFGPAPTPPSTPAPAPETEIKPATPVSPQP